MQNFLRPGQGATDSSNESLPQAHVAGYVIGGSYDSDRFLYKQSVLFFQSLVVRQWLLK
jgi:hypothetical protein